ncbi:MAG: hypothetical protein A3H42_04995 [Deltaproteobacteria bacterium RIFCSPLOWO2_02_FULL_46_8]|nr:MAG: hypothetical protein A3H42_04995 [Deltaproteobacteria bacterium RIFCSPLOWO2_02_FULL_46_8]
MFKKSLLLVTLGVLSLGVVKTLHAENTPAFKIAVVDFQKAINETEDGKKAEAQLNASLTEKRKKFDILKGELKTMTQDFDKQRLVLSGQALEDKKQALQKKVMEVEQKGAGFEQELANAKTESLKKILTGLQSVVQTIGQKDGYTLILERSQGGVLFTSGAKDITPDVIKEYNAHPAKK